MLIESIHIPPRTGEIATDVTAFLIANGKEKTLSHAQGVVAVSQKIAERYGLNTIMCETSALLHDISAVVKHRDMLAYAQDNGWKIDPAEEKYPFLLHQRLSRVIAEAVFNVHDALILDAVECHSTLKVNPTQYDMALFVADKLSWDQEGIAPFNEEVWHGLERSLAHASLAYMKYIVAHGMILYPHQWFIEALAQLERRCENL